VKALLEAPRSLRHRALWAVLYGCGVRVAEVTHLKATDIDATVVTAFRVTAEAQG
jgi:site-specific recombinase XerD